MFIINLTTFGMFVEDLSKKATRSAGIVRVAKMTLFMVGSVLDTIETRPHEQFNTS